MNAVDALKDAGMTNEEPESFTRNVIADLSN